MVISCTQQYEITNNVSDEENKIIQTHDIIHWVNNIEHPDWLVK